MIDKYVSAKYNHDSVLIESFSTLEENEFNQMAQEDKDRFMINEVQAVLRREGNQTQKDLLAHLKECDDVTIGRDKIISLLKTYKDKYWKIQKSGAKNNINTYILIDTDGDLIDKISNKLHQ